MVIRLALVLILSLSTFLGTVENAQAVDKAKAIKKSNYAQYHQQITRYPMQQFHIKLGAKPKNMSKALAKARGVNHQIRLPLRTINPYHRTKTGQYNQ